MDTIYNIVIACAFAIVIKKSVQGLKAIVEQARIR